MNMKRLGQAAIGLLLTGLAGQAAAQTIILYEDSGFRGREVRVNGDVRNLDSVRFNDRASSFRVVSGEWELCQHDDYNGTCELHSSDQASMGRMNDQLTSLRPVVAGRPGRPGGREPSLTFFSGPNYSGRSVTITSSVTNFQRINFNDQARSVRHSGRGTWIACEDANFEGSCMEISGDLANIGGGMGARISSAEPDYAGRPQRPGRGGGNVPRSGVFLFDGAGFNGQRVVVDTDISNLTRMGFNDRAESLIVARGETWIVCDDEGFTDSCQRVQGEVLDLSRLGLRNRITSLRRVDDSWGEPGGGYPGPGGPRADIRGGTRGVNSLFFARPEINGYAVDRCLGTYGNRCDQDAADQMCQAVGMRRASHYSVDRYSRTRTWFIGQDRACSSGQCAPLVDVLCTE